MIESFRCKDTKRLFEDEQPKRFLAIANVARRRLLYVHAATTLQQLRALPGNRLESLKGDRKGQYSIRVNRQWRICFKWRVGHAHDVEIVDYH